jgi:lipoprotein-releasing system permease protein
MFRPFELFVGLRYLRAKRRNHFISFISLTSVIGITLGIIVIITVLSVMNGFQTEIRDRLLRMTAHASLLELDGTLDNWQAAADAVAYHPDIIGVAPYVDGQAMMVKGTQVTGILLRGADPELESNVSEIADFMQGSDFNELQAGQFKIFLGSELAQFLGSKVGDKVTVITPEASITPAGILPKLRRFLVAGIYEVGTHQFDRNTAVIHIEDAKKLYRLGEGVTGLRLKLTDLFLAPRVKNQLNSKLQGKYWVTDWTSSNSNFFRAVKLEKTMMFIIMTLIVAVAAFNVVSMLIMVVTDKQSDIAILRTLGVPARSILWVFIIQGSLIGFVGTVLGTIGGVLLAMNVGSIVASIEVLFNTDFIPSSVYYISDLPSEVQVNDVMLVAAISFFLTVIATLYPAYRAAKTEPAQALRYE